MGLHFPHMLIPQSTPAKNSFVPMLVLGLLLLDGLHFVWARILHEYLPPMASVSWYFIIATLEIGGFAWWQGKLRWQTFRRLWWFFLTIGVCIAISTTTNYIVCIQSIITTCTCTSTRINPMESAVS